MDLNFIKLNCNIVATSLSCALIFNMSEPICENTVWDEKETEKLMKYLWDHTASAGKKDSTYQAAATYITPYHKSGPIKTAKLIKGKYKSVSISLLRHFCFTKCKSNLCR